MLLLLFLTASVASAWSPGDSQPNVLFVLADDLGYADVPWVDHDDVIVASKIAELAQAGIILDRFYAQPSCSPSRAAALTGLYPIHTGFNVRYNNYNDNN